MLSDNQIQVERDNYDMIFLEKYHNSSIKSTVVQQLDTKEGKKIKLYASGLKEISFPSGVRRESYPDGYMVIYFDNKDVRQQYPDGKMVYFFHEHHIKQTITSSGDKILLFKNGQLEKHFVDGRKEITFCDGTTKCVI